MDTKKKIFRTRQAPSPTGYLHLGTARQILFTQLFAMINDGLWFLRIEDTDRQRLQPESVTNLLDTLNKLSLRPDEGVVEVANNSNGKPEYYEDKFYGVFQKGDKGPYIQSERLDLYHQYAQELIDKKLAYWSYLTPQDKEDLQQMKKVTKKPIDYYLENIMRHPKFARSKKKPSTLKKDAESETEHLFADVVTILAKETKPALMYRLQRDDVFECEDQLLGKTKFDLSLEEDFVILKSDGYPTYHLAHLIDDHLMETSLVLRAQEWYPSIAKHQVMFSDFWGKENVPQYLHLPLILGETGNKKLSKRDGNVNMAGYLDEGFLPEAIVNYLAFLGWNPGTDKEVYLDEPDAQKCPQNVRVCKIVENIAKDFNIETISKSPARFGIKKLTWFNREYIKMLSLDQFIELIDNYLEELKRINKETKEEDRAEKCAQILEQIQLKVDATRFFEVGNQLSDQEKLAFLLDKNRIENLSKLGEESQCILGWSKPDKENVKWRKSELKESLKNLKESLGIIEQEYDSISSKEENLVAQFTDKSNQWEKLIKDWLSKNEYDTGSYLWPLRVALSGQAKSPSPFEILSILDKDEIINRIKSVIK